MTAKDLQGKSVEELQEELLTQQKQQFQLRMQHTTGQLGQTHLLKQTRRNIARIKSVLTDKAGK